MRPLLPLLVLLAPVCLLQAEPVNGFGVTVGGVSASQGGLNSAGGSLGVDTQFAVNASWSLNPYLMVSLEKATATSQKVSDNLGGIQFRRWAGPVYFGPQIFFHDRLLINGGQVVSSQYGPGAGVVLGWEGARGWSMGAQLDALEAQFLNTVDRRNAVRVYLGYRWH